MTPGTDGPKPGLGRVLFLEALFVLGATGLAFAVAQGVLLLVRARAWTGWELAALTLGIQLVLAAGLLAVVVLWIFLARPFLDRPTLESCVTRPRIPFLSPFLRRLLDRLDPPR